MIHHSTKPTCLILCICCWSSSDLSRCGLHKNSESVVWCLAPRQRITEVGPDSLDQVVFCCRSIVQFWCSRGRCRNLWLWRGGLNVPVLNVSAAPLWDQTIPTSISESCDWFTSCSSMDCFGTDHLLFCRCCDTVVNYASAGSPPCFRSDPVSSLKTVFNCKRYSFYNRVWNCSEIDTEVLPRRCDCTH